MTEHVQVLLKPEMIEGRDERWFADKVWDYMCEKGEVKTISAHCVLLGLVLEVLHPNFAWQDAGPFFRYLEAIT